MNKAKEGADWKNLGSEDNIFGSRPTKEICPDSGIEELGVEHWGKVLSKVKDFSNDVATSSQPVVLLVRIPYPHI